MAAMLANTKTYPSKATSSLSKSLAFGSISTSIPATARLTRSIISAGSSGEAPSALSSVCASVACGAMSTLVAGGGADIFVPLGT